LAIKYANLDALARRAIWLNFPKLSDAGKACINDAEFDLLAACEMNGREINNTLRTAQTLSQTSEVAITYPLIKDVIAVATNFDDEDN